MISCRTLSVTDVGTSTSRQIRGSVSLSSMRTVAISLKLLVAGILASAVMPPILQPDGSNSRAEARPVRNCLRQVQSWPLLMLGVVRARCLAGRAADAVEFPFWVLFDPGDRQLLSARAAGGEADLIGVFVGRPDGLAELLRVGVPDHAEDDRKGGEHGCLSRRFVQGDIASRKGPKPLCIGRIRL